MKHNFRHTVHEVLASVDKLCSDFILDITSTTMKSRTPAITISYLAILIPDVVLRHFIFQMLVGLAMRKVFLSSNETSEHDSLNDLVLVTTVVIWICVIEGFQGVDEGLTC